MTRGEPARQPEPRRPRRAARPPGGGPRARDPPSEPESDTVDEIDTCLQNIDFSATRASACARHHPDTAHGIRIYRSSRPRRPPSASRGVGVDARLGLYVCSSEFVLLASLRRADGTGRVIVICLGRGPPVAARMGGSGKGRHVAWTTARNRTRMVKQSDNGPSRSAVVPVSTSRRGRSYTLRIVSTARNAFIPQLTARHRRRCSPGCSCLA